MTERCQVEEEEYLAGLEHQQWFINTQCRPLLIPNNPAALESAQEDFMIVTLTSSQSSKLATKALNFLFSHSRSKTCTPEADQPCT